MPFFRMRLILALIAGITLVSVGSTYFDVLAHKLFLRRELVRRSAWLGASLEPELEQAIAAGGVDPINAALKHLQRPDETLGLAVYDREGELLGATGSVELFKALPTDPVLKAMRKGTEVAVFGHDANSQWLEDTFPLRANGQLSGVLVVLEDAGFIRAEGNAVWQRSFWRIVAFVVLIVGVTLLMVRWFLMRPMLRVAERLRRLRLGHTGEIGGESIAELSLFTPLAREVETMAESLVKARAAAQAEARLRDAGEHLWTAERLAVHMRERFGSSRLFVVSNREPYMHVRKGWETVCLVPPSGRPGRPARSGPSQGRRGSRRKTPRRGVGSAGHRRAGGRRFAPRASPLPCCRRRSHQLRQSRRSRGCGSRGAARKRQATSGSRGEPAETTRRRLEREPGASSLVASALKIGGTAGMTEGRCLFASAATAWGRALAEQITRVPWRTSGRTRFPRP